MPEFEVIFPGDTDIAFLEEVEQRIDSSIAEDFWSDNYANPVEKSSVSGIHGILHLTGSPCKKEFFPSRKESDSTRKLRND